MKMINADIYITNLKKYFNSVKAVDGINLEINKGEFVALLGPNGAGKTTLVEMIEGIQKPDSGEIYIKGKKWEKNGDELRRILGISLQETNFFEKITVFETLNLFASFYDLNEDRINCILNLVNLEEKKNVYVNNLSGGQRQRLALGIALLNDAQILLLDEPTTGLDPSSRQEIWNILLRLKKENKISLILTTHYMEEAEFLCERIIIMDKGKILAEGQLDQLLSSNSSSEIIEFTFEQNVNEFKFSESNEILSFIWDEKTKKGKITIKNIVNFLPVFMENVKQQNLKFKTLICRKMTLNDLFISMTGRHLEE